MRTIDSWDNDLWTMPHQRMRPVRVEDDGGTAWPAGRHTIANRRLKHLLARSARWHARIAVTNLGSDDLDELLQAAISTGCAVELITKAFLASVSHSLLADRSDHHSLLLLAGRSDKTKRTGTELATRTAAEVCKIARDLDARVVSLPQNPVCLRVRNAAAHMGLVDVRELRLGVGQMVKYIDKILEVLDLDGNDFWGEADRALVESLLDEARSETAKAAMLKRANAEAHLAMLTALVPPETVPAVLQALAKPSAEDGGLTHECPVCGQEGYFQYDVERGALEVEYDDEGMPANPWVSRWANVFGFACPVCQLELDYEELTEFNLATTIQLEDDTEPAEYYDYEPDEDYLRDR
jgi:hypothetical protein